MIQELKYRFFISLSEKAKRLHKPKPSHHKSLASKSDVSIDHLSIKNQRRIKRLRAKKESTKDIIKILRQEVLEHKMTRDQLHAAINYLKHEHAQYKQTVKKNSERLKVIEGLRKQLSDIRFVVSKMGVDDVNSMKIQQQIIRLDDLIKQKESELSLE